MIDPDRDAPARHSSNPQSQKNVVAQMTDLRACFAIALLISTLSLTPTTGQAADPTCARITEDVPLRQTPNGGPEPELGFQKGDTVEVIQSDKDLTFVRIEEVLGWVESRYLEPTDCAGN
jgi:hypothetical protein